jgi:hypothetical protein
MTEAEFAELTEGETVNAGSSFGNGTITYFTEHGAGVTFEDGTTLTFERTRLSRA